ncbi:hypothetical protein PCANB_000370 [Pneumocystis canis]|nr:hypothetical protein PCANB_000370 [Pneumocystis canis]
MTKKQAYEALSHEIKSKEYKEKLGTNSGVYDPSYLTKNNAFYKEYNKKTQRNNHFSEYLNKERNNNFTNHQNTQENLYSNTYSDYEIHYETYYAYKQHLMKHLKREKNLVTPMNGFCFTNFLGISTIIFIVILLSSFCTS